jgi:hypothetical protein
MPRGTAEDEETSSAEDGADELADGESSDGDKASSEGEGE